MLLKKTEKWYDVVTGVGVASKALVTNAAIGRSIFAVTVGSATGGARGGSYGRHAEELGVADESLPADAGLGVGVAVGVQAAGLSPTSVNASSWCQCYQTLLLRMNKLVRLCQL